MSKKRKQYSAAFKPKVALAALKGNQTTSELFEGNSKAGKCSDESCIDVLYREIGRLTVERDFLSRKLDQ